MNQPAIDIEPCRPIETPCATILVVAEGQGVPPQTIQSLALRGVTADRVDSGAEALRQLERQSYVAALIDSGVDGRQGLDLLERMRTLSPDLGVVMITAAATVRHAVEAMRQGAADYLMQPVSAEALENCVLELLSAKRRQPSRRSENPAGENNPFVTKSPAVQQILATGRSVAGSQATVLITGESGTGKEVLASYIHRHSPRSEAPYIAVNCAALPDTLMESELFGYEKGAFTGALNRKIGKFEQAGQGTLVLDEISEMPLTLQAKLLRVLQERRIDRIGGDRLVPFEAQVIAISNRHLDDLVRKGRMREDLYYRINVIPLHLPPLRQRREDIPGLVRHFLDCYSAMYQRKAPLIDASLMAELESRDWKGNIRELENYIERSVLVGSPVPLEIQSSASGAMTPGDDVDMAIRPGLSVKAVEEALIKRTLHEVNDHRERAAKMLGISVRTLRNKLNDYKKHAELLEKGAP